MSGNYVEEIKVALIRKQKDIKWLADELKVTRQDVSITLKRLKDGKGITVEKLDKIGKALEITFSVGA